MFVASICTPLAHLICLLLLTCCTASLVVFHGSFVALLLQQGACSQAAAAFSPSIFLITRSRLLSSSYSASSTCGTWSFATVFVPLIFKVDSSYIAG
jgi:hypothetical protein